MSAKADKVKVDVEQVNARGEVTPEEIAVRAYEIHISGTGGDEVENWLRAEKELKQSGTPSRELKSKDEAEHVSPTAPE